ncbi:unnamed protein product [Symbiodinium sp. CCMP2592]|nr:unnamed protein product [Symbiodinium sp. CCMP2592]
MASQSLVVDWSQAFHGKIHQKLLYHAERKPQSIDPGNVEAASDPETEKNSSEASSSGSSTGSESPMGSPDVGAPAAASHVLESPEHRKQDDMEVSTSDARSKRTSSAALLAPSGLSGEVDRRLKQRVQHIVVEGEELLDLDEKMLDFEADLNVHQDWWFDAGGQGGGEVLRERWAKRTEDEGPPQCFEEDLQSLDLEAEAFEAEKLLKMKVLEPTQEEPPSELVLNTRYVHDWLSRWLGQTGKTGRLQEGNKILGKLGEKYVMTLTGPIRDPGEQIRFSKRLFVIEEAGLAMYSDPKYLQKMAKLLGITRPRMRKDTIALSSCESELISAVSGCADGLYIKSTVEAMTKNKCNMMDGVFSVKPIPTRLNTSDAGILGAKEFQRQGYAHNIGKVTKSQRKAMLGVLMVVLQSEGAHAHDADPTTSSTLQRIHDMLSMLQVWIEMFMVEKDIQSWTVFIFVVIFTLSMLSFFVGVIVGRACFPKKTSGAIQIIEKKTEVEKIIETASSSSAPATERLEPTFPVDTSTKIAITKFGWQRPASRAVDDSIAGRFRAMLELTFDSPVFRALLLRRLRLPLPLGRASGRAVAANGASAARCAGARGWQARGKADGSASIDTRCTGDRQERRSGWQLRCTTGRQIRSDVILQVGVQAVQAHEAASYGMCYTDARGELQCKGLSEPRR